MNIHQLTPTEASYLLFSIRKTLHDETGLTPDMKQFYESSYDALSAKIDRCRDGGSQAEVRNKFAKVRPTWGDVPLSGESAASPRDYE